MGPPSAPYQALEAADLRTRTRARGMVAQARHTRVGPVKSLGYTIHYSVTPAKITRGAPLLGEHTLEVLAQHGYSQAKSERFVALGAVVSKNREKSPGCSYFVTPCQNPAD